MDKARPWRHTYESSTTMPEAEGERASCRPYSIPYLFPLSNSPHSCCMYTSLSSVSCIRLGPFKLDLQQDMHPQFFFSLLLAVLDCSPPSCQHGGILATRVLQTDHSQMSFP